MAFRAGAAAIIGRPERSFGPGPRDCPTRRFL
jgi:hypothetical protein